MKFRATLLLEGKTATGIEVPVDVYEGLGGGKRPKVTVTIGAYSYRSTVSPYNGRIMLPVSAENRAGAGIEAGEEVEVDLELDLAPRVVEVPPDFAEAMAVVPGARDAFDALSYTRQREHVTAIEGAKQAETRERRIGKAVATLTDA